MLSICRVHVHVYGGGGGGGGGGGVITATGEKVDLLVDG